MKKGLIAVLAGLTLGLANATAALASVEAWGFVYNFVGASCNNCTAFGSPPSATFAVNAGVFAFYPPPPYPVDYSVYARQPTATSGCYYFSAYVTRRLTNGSYKYPDLHTTSYGCP
jgi:hypothetical protein